MEFRQFQYILKVAQLGNITKAAEELYMAQPALSRFIAKVEKDEGIKIFDRTTNPISLTYAGERYIDTVRRIIELGDQFQEEVAEITANKKGKLIIGIPPARAANLLPRILPEYHRRYPYVTIQTVEHNFRQLKEDVRKGQVDFAVVPRLDGLEEYRCINLFEEELFLVAQKGTLPESAIYLDKNHCRVVRLSELRDQAFILLKNGHGIRGALDVIFEYNGFKPNILFETTNNETAYGLAAAGMGAAIVPRMNVESLKHLHAIDVCRLSESGLKWMVSAVFNAEESGRYFAAKCVELIQEVYRSDAAGNSPAAVHSHL